MGTPDRRETEQAFASLGALAAVKRLGITGKIERQGRGGALVCCPSHKENNPSCSVQMIGGKILFKCHACDFAGSVFDAIAAIEGLSLPHDFPRVIEAAAALVGVFGDSAPLVDRRPMPEPEPETPFPSLEAVGELIAVCGVCSRDRDVSTYLQSRRFDPHQVDVRGLAWCLPVDAVALLAKRASRVDEAKRENVKQAEMWARYWVMQGRRIVVPAYDATGELRSLRGWSWTETKRKPLFGCRAAGLLMADAMGLELLRAGKWPSWAICNEVLICEGEPDMMTFALESALYAYPRRAVLSVASTTFARGGMQEIAARIPAGTRVRVATHDDDAGNDYARDIASPLVGKCSVERMRLAA